MRNWTLECFAGCFQLISNQISNSTEIIVEWNLLEFYFLMFKELLLLKKIANTEIGIFLVLAANIRQINLRCRVNFYYLTFTL